jgi:tRNA (guanine9-N1)-methyltransferase
MSLCLQFDQTFDGNDKEIDLGVSACNAKSIVDDEDANQQNRASQKLPSSDSETGANNTSECENLTRIKSSDVPLELSSTFVDTTADATEVVATTMPLLSKNQLKKRRRLQKAMDIKQRKKQQNKQVKLERAKAQGRDIDAERLRQDEARKAGNSAHRIQRRREWEQSMIPKIQQSFQICLDCAFESLMTAKEINSLAIQIRYCYSNNKRSQHPCRLIATSIGNTGTGSSNDDANNPNIGIGNNTVTLNHLKKVNGFDEWSNWAFDITSDSLEQYFHDNMNKVVYLTSDSETTLSVLENDKIYVIGGIVDRNRLKRITMDRANAIGVKTAKLPIDEHLSHMPSTRVLTTNHVFELLLKYKEHNGCWKKALADVLPIRKDAKFMEVPV